MSNVEKIIDGQLVVWDKKKSALNLQKHGVDFEDAALFLLMKIALNALTKSIRKMRIVGKSLEWLRIFCL